MDSEYCLYDLLEVENHPSLLEFKCAETGLLLWPLVRIQFLRSFIYDLMYDAKLINRCHHRNYSVALLSIAKSIMHNIKHMHQARCNVLIMATGAGNVIKEGCWFNRLSDHFALAANRDTLVVEDLFEWRWPFPRHNEHVLFHTPLQMRGMLSGRLLARDRHKRLAENLISLARSRAKKHLNWELGDERSTLMSSFLTHQIAGMPFRRRAYEQMLALTGAKVIIKEEGCYGHSGVLNATARDMGLVVAEYQHGVISAGHDAYNVAPTLARSSAYRKTLPQFFLGYGQCWNDQINTPVDKIAIGNPHRTEQLRLFADRNVAKSDILVLGDGIETDMYFGLARSIATGIGKDLRVVFRPHPLERAKVFSAYSVGCVGDVHIDRNPDIYESFCSAHAVVSEVSTGLFEAVGLADRVFLWNTLKARFSYPIHPFASFSDAIDLIEKIRNSDEGYLNLQSADQVWAPEWRENYLTFLRDIGGVSC